MERDKESNLEFVSIKTRELVHSQIKVLFELELGLSKPEDLILSPIMPLYLLTVIIKGTFPQREP
jgi:hypothetical protein